MEKHEIETQLERLIKATRGPTRQALQQALIHHTTPKHAGLTEHQMANHSAGKLPDPLCPGLYLEATARKGRLWRVRTQTAGRDTIHTLGSYPEMPLAAAREAVLAVRKGTLPTAPVNENASQARSQGVSKAIRLGELSDKFLQFAEKNIAAKTVDSYRRGLRRIIDALGDIRVDQIEREALRDAIIEIGDGKPATGRMTLQAVRKAWAVGQGKDKRLLLKSRDLWVPADLDPIPVISFDTAAREFRGLDDGELQDFIDGLALSATSRPVALALAVQLSGGMRVSEVAKIQKDWVSDDRVTFPVGTTKNKREHIVHLGETASALVARMVAGKRVSTDRVQKELAAGRDKLGLAVDMGTHSACRRTPATWWREQGFSLEVRQVCLNHVSGGGVTRRYDRSANMDAQARAAFTAWQDHLDGLGLAAILRR